MQEQAKTPSFKETGLRSPITEFALSLLATRDGAHFASGTAFVIAPRLAITSRHVVEDHFKRFEARQLSAPVDAGSFMLEAFQVLDGGDTAELWTIDRIWGSAHTDVAFLRLVPQTERAAAYEWRGIRLNLFPPAVGERVVAFGYHSSATTMVGSTSDATLEWRDSPTTSVGEVLEIHEKRRDAVLLPFPCFRTNARFDGGMSGGPVFDAAGQLCGLICSTIAAAEGGEEHSSYVSTLWPAMGTLIDMAYEGGPIDSHYPVLELAQRGTIAAPGHDRIVLVRGADGSVSRVSLTSNGPDIRAPAP